MTKKQKVWLIRIIAAAILFAVAIVLERDTLHIAMRENPKLELYVFAVPYLLVGYDVIWKALRNIAHGQIFDENFLMMVATFGAIGIGEYPEAVAVMLFYQIGEFFQNFAVERSRKSIAALMDICPETAFVEQGKKIVEMDPDDVEIGSIIVVKAGERVPIDGVVTEGSSMLDTSALTGEPVPRRASKGDMVLSGCINGSETLKIKTEKAFEDSAVSRILELVENAASKKAKTENFITRFAKFYTPVVTIIAVCLALIPPLVLSDNWEPWIETACIFLVISCPCALVISVPLGFFSGIGAASRRGILIKGSNYLEAAAGMDTLVFDKTGTLTKGDFTVSEVNPNGCEKDYLLEVAANAEGMSTHPIAESIKKAYGKELNLDKVTKSENKAGKGIRAKYKNRIILVGNEKLMEWGKVDYEPCRDSGTVVYVARSGKFLGSIVISDTVKEDMEYELDDLRTHGIRKRVMLTGDNEEVARSVAEELGFDDYRAGLLPEDKLTVLEELLAKKWPGKKLGYVGDGINDAPVLSRADVGIAMGSMGSDAAIEAADIVIMDDDLGKLSPLMRIARKTMSIVRVNIVFCLVIKAMVMLFGLLGMANMWAAVFADVGVAILAILNSMRILGTK